MRITKISIQDLFGMPSFTYKIELKTDPPITIIHGPNGSGKTVIFKMIAGLFNSNYFIFWKYPFSEFRVDFDDNEHILVTRTHYGSKSPEQTPLPQFKEDFEDQFEIQYPVIQYSKAPNDPFSLQINSRFLRRLPPSMRHGITRDEIDEFIMTFAEEGIGSDFYENPLGQIVARFGDELWQETEEPQWLHDLSANLNVNLIDTNRLLIHKLETDERIRRPEPRNVSAIEENSRDLSQRIQSVILRADTQAKILDRSFPSRVVDSVVARNKDISPYSSIRADLDTLEQKRNRLVEVGLLEPGEQQAGFQIPEDGESYSEDTTLRNVLQIYITDTQEKLSVYQELAERIEIFKDIIQEMLRYKKLSISKEGFDVQSDAGRTIPLRELSSGEQHMIVLIYNLLFRAKSTEDELILIDEPEISLHIAWQKRFVTNLEKISKLSKFDVIIATHSPAIINGRFDLEVSIQSERNRGE